MDLTLLTDGTIVMIIGMGTVFIFLTIMIWCMDLNGKVLQYVNKFFPEEVVEEKKSVKTVSNDNNDEVALAVACAAAGKTI